jgi:hypothetical protein
MAAIIVRRLAIVLMSTVTLSGCAWWSQNGHTVLSDVNKLCILANVVYPNATIRTICGIEGDLADAEKQIEAVATPSRVALANAKKVGFEEGAKTTGACKP